MDRPFRAQLCASCKEMHTLQFLILNSKFLIFIGRCPGLYMFRPFRAISACIALRTGVNTPAWRMSPRWGLGHAHRAETLVLQFLILNSKFLIFIGRCPGLYMLCPFRDGMCASCIDTLSSIDFVELSLHYPQLYSHEHHPNS